MSGFTVEATVRYEAEQKVTVYIEAEREDAFGFREVLDAVYASGELLDAIDLDVRDYAVRS